VGHCSGLVVTDRESLGWIILAMVVCLAVTVVSLGFRGRGPMLLQLTFEVHLHCRITFPYPHYQHPLHFHYFISRSEVQSRECSNLHIIFTVLLIDDSVYVLFSHILDVFPVSSSTSREFMLSDPSPELVEPSEGAPEHRWWKGTQ
jgi:hypothetical protein